MYELDGAPARSARHRGRISVECFQHRRVARPTWPCALRQLLVRWFRSGSKASFLRRGWGRSNDTTHDQPPEHLTNHRRLHNLWNDEPKRPGKRALALAAQPVAAPLVWPTMLGFAPIVAAMTLLTEAALSVLGIGVQPPQASWGTLIADGQMLIYSRPWVAIAPGLAVVVTVLALNLLADGHA